MEMNVLIHKFVPITTDGAPAMTSENVDLILGFSKEDPTFPGFFSYHYVSHQQVLCTSVRFSTCDECCAKKL
jgi:hypothetical protein